VSALHPEFALSALPDQPAPAIAATKPDRTLHGIGLKVASVVAFVIMSSLLKAAEGIPAGQLVFYRSFFAIFPIVLFLVWRGQLLAGIKTANLPGHLLRGFIGVASMGLGFYGLTQLPLPESIAISYAMPLLIVVLSALVLKERVHFFRWSAVLVGLAGVAIMIWPRLTLLTGGSAIGTGETAGALAALAAAGCAAFAMLQVHKLTQTERTETIVFYFSLSASVIALVTIPFGWVWPTPQQAILLVLAGFAGGVGQILLTSSYRHANPSAVAPFEYSSLLLGLVIGYFAFGDIPTPAMLIGAIIVIASGIAVILREHRLGLDRTRAREAGTP
jgi:drug/metabolite transporter (DMT)-like permease